MIDIETLGVGPSAPILQIGGVEFSSDGIHLNHFRCNVIHGGSGWGSPDAETMLWWVQQPVEVMRGAFHQEGAKTLQQALRDLTSWVGDANIWTNGPAEDVTWLKTAFERVGMPWPWSHRQIRCFRTVVKEFGVDEDEPQRDMGSVEHDAHSDALHQALWLIRVYNRLGCVL